MKVKVTPKFKVGQTVSCRGQIWVVNEVNVLVNCGIHIQYSLARYCNSIVVDSEDNGHSYDMLIDGCAWFQENELEETNEVYECEVYDEDDDNNFGDYPFHDDWDLEGDEWVLTEEELNQNYD